MYRAARLKLNSLTENITWHIGLQELSPVSNLGFVSKVTERAVADQLKSYSSINNLDAELQSACGVLYSTETDLSKVVSDSHLAPHQNQRVIPCF